MIKQTVVYENFDGVVVTEELYFHMSKNELIRLETGDGPSLSSRLLKIQSSDVTGGEIIRMFGEIIGLSYGIREGGDFRKSEEISEHFLQSLAYDQLLGDLMTNPELVATFVNGIFPKDLMKMAEQMSGQTVVPDGTITEADISESQKVLRELEAAADDNLSGLEHPRDSKGTLLPWAHRAPSKREQQSMSKVQLIDVMQRQAKGWVPRSQAD